MGNGPTRRERPAARPARHAPTLRSALAWGMAGSDTAATKAGGETARGRLWEVDAARGLAVVAMIGYHLVFDLAAFGDLDVAPQAGLLAVVADGIAALFVLLTGVSAALAAARPTPPGVHRRRTLHRAATILAAGVVVSVATWLVDPVGFVRFGILQLIGVSIVLALPFGGRPRLALVVGAVLLAGGPVALAVRVDTPWLIPFGLRPPDLWMLDYRPLVPWFGVVLIGIALGWALYGRRGGRSLAPTEGRSPPARVLAWLGRHSLAVYLVHQPVMLTILSLLGLVDLGIGG